MENNSNTCYINLTAQHTCENGTTREVLASFACEADTLSGFRSSLEIRVSPPRDIPNKPPGYWVGETMSEALAKFGISMPSDNAAPPKQPVKLAATDHSAIADTKRNRLFPMRCEFLWDGEKATAPKMFSPDPRITWQKPGGHLTSDVLPCELSTQSLDSILRMFGTEAAPPAGIPAIPWEFPALGQKPPGGSLVVLEPAIQRNPHILHGAPSFPGSRVFVSSLMSSLMSGETVDDFVQIFPSVKRERAVAALAALTDENLVAAEKTL